MFVAMNDREAHPGAQGMFPGQLVSSSSEMGYPGGLDLAHDDPLGDPARGNKRARIHPPGALASFAEPNDADAAQLGASAAAAAAAFLAPPGHAADLDEIPRLSAVAPAATAKPVTAKWRTMKPEQLALTAIPQLLASYNALLEQNPGETRHADVPDLPLERCGEFTTSQCEHMLEHVKRILADRSRAVKNASREKAGKSHGCDTCGAAFAYPAKLREHRNIHLGLNPHACDREGCDAKFPTRDRLRTHIQKHDPKHDCDVCGKRFQTSAVLRTHALVHTAERPHACGEEGCGKMFKTASALETHALSHGEARRFACPVDGCEKSFRESTQLCRHRVKVHNIRLRSRYGKRAATGEFVDVDVANEGEEEEEEGAAQEGGVDA